MRVLRLVCYSMSTDLSVWLVGLCPMCASQEPALHYGIHQGFPFAPNAVVRENMYTSSRKFPRSKDECVALRIIEYENSKSYRHLMKHTVSIHHISCGQMDGS